MAMGFSLSAIVTVSPGLRVVELPGSRTEEPVTVGSLELGVSA